MALQGSGSGATPDVSMSAKDINFELAESLTAPFDFGGAAVSFSGITDDTTIEMLEFYNKTFTTGADTYGTRDSLVVNYFVTTEQGDGPGDPTTFPIGLFQDGELIDCAEYDTSSFATAVDPLAKTVFHTKFDDATFDTGDYLYRNSTGTDLAIFTSPNSVPAGVGTMTEGAGWQDGFMMDSTTDKVIKYDVSSGETLLVRDRTPSTPGTPNSNGTSTTTSVGITFTSNTQVTNTFKVYKSTSSGGTYSEHTNKTITSFSKGSEANTSVTITITVNGLSSSTDYFFKVAGVNGFATGTQSNNNIIAIATSAGGGGNGVGCFAYGTQILMSDGTTKNIEEMVVGDVVKSMSIPDMPIVEGEDDDWNTYKDFTTNSLVSSSLSTATVKRVRWFSYDDYYKITLGNGDILKVTYHHPLFVQRDGVYQWTKVNHTELSSSLKTTDLLVDKDKNTQTISSIDYVNEILDVATIDVEDLDVYFANNYLAYNKA